MADQPIRPVERAERPAVRGWRFWTGLVLVPVALAILESYRDRRLHAPLILANRGRRQFAVVFFFTTIIIRAVVFG